MQRYALQLLDHDLPACLSDGGNDQLVLRIAFLHDTEQWDNRDNLAQGYGMDPNDGLPKALQFERDRSKSKPQASLTAFFGQQERQNNGRDQDQH